jgi:hypothetical protein
LRGAERRGNPELKFNQNFKSGLPRSSAPRNDGKMLSQALFVEISSKKRNPTGDELLQF